MRPLLADTSVTCKSEFLCQLEPFLRRLESVQGELPPSMMMSSGSISGTCSR